MKDTSLSGDDSQSVKLGRCLNKTPNEILFRIFSFVDDPLLIQQVCQRFRAIVLHFPALWSTPPFRPNKMTEFFLSRSKNALLNIKVDDYGYHGSIPNETCDCADYLCTCAQRSYLSSVIPHFRRCRTLDIEKISPELRDFFFTTLNLWTNTEPLSKKFPALYWLRVPNYVDDLLNRIGPDLIELEYCGWSRYVSQESVKEIYGMPRKFSDVLNLIEKFSRLRKLYLSLPAILSCDVPERVIEFPLLESLYVGAKYSRDDMVLTRILQIIQTQHLTSLGLKIHYGNWQHLHDDRRFWGEITLQQHLTCLTIDDSMDLEEFGPKAIVTKVMAYCHNLVELTVICKFPQLPDGAIYDNPIPEESWHMRCPLERLRLLDCYTYLEDLLYLGVKIRTGPSWDKFGKIILGENPNRYDWCATINSNYTRDTPDGKRLRLELEEFLQDFKERMEGKVEWQL